MELHGVLLFDMRFFLVDACFAAGFLEVAVFFLGERSFLLLASLFSRAWFKASCPSAISDSTEAVG